MRLPAYRGCTQSKPDHPAVRAAFRRLAASAGPDAASRSADLEPHSPSVSPACLAPTPVRIELDSSPPPPPTHDDSISELDDAEAEARVSSLTDKIRANPSDHEAATELCALLERLGRDMDLFALVSARLDETDVPELRRSLEHYKRVALQRLASAARSDGRHDEASIYDEALSAMEVS